MAKKKRSVLFRRTRKFRDAFYRYSMIKKNDHISISIEEIKDEKTSYKSMITDPEYSETVCMAFITILADTLTFPEQLQEIYEENDLNELPLE